MSAVDKQEFEQAFPVIQDDDLFGGFSSSSLTMNSVDPFASAAGEPDPFSAFDVSVTSKAAANPFLDGNLNECPAPSHSTSRTTTPVDELQSFRSDEVPWPGNNTAESSADASRDSAAVSDSSDVAIPQDNGCSRMDTSESSASSGRTVPNIALDSDSGNLTTDANENACLPNTVYTLIDPTDGESTIPTNLTELPTPKIVLTEASVISEKSSNAEGPENSTSNGDGHSRLLESSEMETSQDHSFSNLATISSHDGSAAQVDNLSTMNISLINSQTDSLVDAQITEAPQASNFFTQTGGSHGDDAEEDCAMKSELTEEVSQERDGAHSLPMPKTNRVFTSSPINPRTKSSVEVSSVNDVLTSWKTSNREKISSKDEKEKKDIEKLREQAKSDLEEWYRDRQTKIEAQHILHLEHQDVQYAERPKDEEKTIWQRMASLALELNQAHKVDEKRKDTSKMKHLLQLLAVRAPSLKQ